MAGQAFIVSLLGLDGTPESGGKLYSYVRSTSTPRTLYTDIGLTTPATNPVIADALGTIDCNFDTALQYTWTAKTADDAVTLWSVDVVGGVLTLTYVNPAYSVNPLIEASWVPALGTPLGSGWPAVFALPAAGVLDNLSGVRFVASNAALTALTAATGLADGAVYQTLCGTATGDGQQRLWRYDAASTATAVDRTLLAIDGGGAGRFLALTNVLSFGTNASPLAVGSGAGFGAQDVTLHINSGGDLGAALYYADAATTKMKAGTGGIGAARVDRVDLVTGWAKGASPEAGGVVHFLTASTTVGGTLFVGGDHVEASVTAGAVLRGREIDISANGVSVAEKRAHIVVSPNTDTGAVTSSLTVSGSLASVPLDCAYEAVAVGAGVGFYNMFQTIKSNGGTQPIKTTGQLWRAGGFTCAYGLDWLDMSFSGAMMRGPNNSPLLVGRNAENSANVEVARVDATNRVSLAGGAVIVDPATGGITTPLSPLAHVDMNGVTQNVAVSTTTAIAFARATTNVTAAFNTGTYLFTPALGEYEVVYAGVMTTNIVDGDDVTITLRKNGATYRQHTFSAAQVSLIGFGGVIAFTQTVASDYWDLAITVDPASGAGARALNSNTANTWATWRQVG